VVRLWPPTTTALPKGLYFARSLADNTGGGVAAAGDGCILVTADSGGGRATSFLIDETGIADSGGGRATSFLIDETGIASTCCWCARCLAASTGLEESIGLRTATGANASDLEEGATCRPAFLDAVMEFANRFCSSEGGGKVGAAADADAGEAKKGEADADAEAADCGNREKRVGAFACCCTGAPCRPAFLDAFKAFANRFCSAEGGEKVGAAAEAEAEAGEAKKGEAEAGEAKKGEAAEAAEASDPRLRALFIRRALFAATPSAVVVCGTAATVATFVGVGLSIGAAELGADKGTADAAALDPSALVAFELGAGKGAADAALALLAAAWALVLILWGKGLCIVV